MGHGWFSKKCVDWYSKQPQEDKWTMHLSCLGPPVFLPVKYPLAAWYQTSSGEPVLVTAFSAQPVCPSSWGDEVYVGEVTEHLRSATDEEAKEKANEVTSS